VFIYKYRPQITAKDFIDLCVEMDVVFMFESGIVTKEPFS